MKKLKKSVYDFWNKKSCGEELYLFYTTKAGFMTQSLARYSIEPYISKFADFTGARDLKVLEIGVGLGADHQKFAEAGANLWGIDLTEHSIKYTAQRLKSFRLKSRLAVGDAENLKFADDSFDRVYSWGVLHHTPNTPKAIAEVFRVLKPQGKAYIMIYNKWSVVGFMLYVRYAILGLRFWLNIDQIYAQYLESRGTKAYSISETKNLFASFSHLQVTTVLNHADLLESNVGQRHNGLLLNLARKFWPRSLIRRYFPNAGLTMMVLATK
jgi:ubiquinone/menaquinone biosynthesis C-methylase UbiE